jgi:hypothetical protein
MFIAGWHRRTLPLYVEGRKVGSVPVHPLSGLHGRLKEDMALGIEGEPTILWAWTRGTAQTARAHAFRPKPSMVLRMGQSSERLLIWALREAIPVMLCEGANKRLSYAFRAPYTRSTVESLRIPLTTLTANRKRPVSVEVTRMELEPIFLRSEVVGRLKEPPAPYMVRLRAGLIER